MTEDRTTSHAFDAHEVAVGITAYRSPNVPGFHAVVKARYSDFIVREVSLDGRVATLSSMTPTLEEDRKRKRDDREPKKDTTPDVPPDVAVPLDWSKLEPEISSILGDATAASAVRSFFEAEPTESNKFTPLPPCKEKKTRGEIHQWIRERLSRHACADTIEEKGNKIIRIWHRRFQKEMPNYDKFERGQQRLLPRAPKGLKYTSFVLYKENMDTAWAINQIQKRVGGRGRLRMGYAGMKDKRGVTCQFVTVPSSIPVEKLAALNRSGEGGGHRSTGGAGLFRLGNFQYVEDELRLGRLEGNRFEIGLRNLKPLEGRDDASGDMTEAVNSWKGHGFINYFGMQRFGKFHDTHLVGKAVLQGNYELAVEIIMRPKTGERDDVTAARQEWMDRFAGDGDKEAMETDCAERVLRKLGRFMQSEVAVLTSLSKNPLQYKRAFEYITKTMRMMFVHAFQSLLWNTVASWRINELGPGVVVGDLVAQETKKQPYVVSQEDVDSNKFTMRDVILPLLGDSSIYPSNGAKKVYEDLLEANDIKVADFTCDGRDFNSSGDYRNVLCYPKDVEAKIVRYKDAVDPLVSTDLMRINDIAIPEQPNDGGDSLLGCVIAFTLPSSAYATVALRELTKTPTSGEHQSSLSLS